MFPAVNPVETKAWKLLEAHYAEMKGKQLRDLFREDPDRFLHFSTCIDEIVFDYSKNNVNEQTISLLTALAEEVGLKEAIEADEKAIAMATRFGYSLPNAYKSLGSAFKTLIEQTPNRRLRKRYETRLDALRKGAAKAKAQTQGRPPLGEIR
jgi:hypothetical protein